MSDKLTSIQEDANGNSAGYQTLVFQDSGDDEPGDKIKAGTGENIGLRVKCGATGVKTFFYRYTNPITSKLVQVKIGNFPEASLAEARLKLRELKQVRRQGRCPATQAKEEKRQNRLVTPAMPEAVLGHSRKGIEGTYDLHRYEAECRQWLQKWADHLDALIRD